MKILVAPDKFRGSLSAEEATEAICEGIAQGDPHSAAIPFPLADGGEGSARILTIHNRGTMVRTTVSNPLFKPVEADYGISGDGKTAFVEMAAASGLHLIEPGKRNCYHTTSYGTGELIVDALNRGVKNIVLGLGGSATNDAGMGMAAALGYRFPDKDGNELEPVGRNLAWIDRIDASNAFSGLTRPDVRVACDVDNPLHGAQGAAHIYGPQKGASPQEVEQLDRGLVRFASVVKDQMGKDTATVPGAGAAGGLGAGCLAFLDAALVPGTRLIMEDSGFEERLAGSDLVITGEGRLDEQTLRGKVVDIVCRMASALGKPVLVLCGQNALQNLPTHMKEATIYALIDRFPDAEQAISNARDGLAALAREVTGSGIRNR